MYDGRILHNNYHKNKTAWKNSTSQNNSMDYLYSASMANKGTKFLTLVLLHIHHCLDKYHKTCNNLPDFPIYGTIGITISVQLLWDFTLGIACKSNFYNDDVFERSYKHSLVWHSPFIYKF